MDLHTNRVSTKRGSHQQGTSIAFCERVNADERIAQLISTEEEDEF